MPALSNQKVISFARIALQGVSSEVKFDAGGKERPMLMQLQMACAYRSQKDPMLDYQEQVDMLVNPDKRSVTGMSPSVLSLFNTSQKVFQTEKNPDLTKLTIPSDGMCMSLKKREPLLTDDFVTACCLLWCGDLCTMDGGNNDTLSALNVVRNHSFGPGKVGKPSLVSMESVVKFLFPFNVSVRGVSCLGKTHYKHKIRPYDTTETLHTFITNKFGMKFKKTYVTSEDAKTQKMPSDVRIYCSNTVGGKSEEIVPSKLKIVAEVCGEDSVVFIESAYVEHFQLTHGGGGPAGKKNSMGKELQNSTQNILEMLAHPPMVHVKAATPFPRPYDTAHTWSVTVMARYLTDVMELPQYETNFLRYEINGYAFMCLDANVTERCCGVEDELHSAKISLHADNLRRKVFKTALKHLPLMLRDWHPVHIAALLQFRYNSPDAAIKILRRQADGNKLADMTQAAITASVSRFGCAEDEARRTVEGLLDILGAHLAATKGRDEKEEAKRREKKSQSNMAEDTEQLLNGDTEAVRRVQGKKERAIVEEEEEDVAVPDYPDDEEEDITDNHATAVDEGGSDAEEEGELSDAAEEEGADGGDESDGGHSDLDEDLPSHLKMSAAPPTAADSKESSKGADMAEKGLSENTRLGRSVKFTRALTQLYDNDGKFVGHEDDSSLVGGEPSMSESIQSTQRVSKPPASEHVKQSQPNPTVVKKQLDAKPASVKPSVPSPKKQPSAKAEPLKVEPVNSSIIAHITALQQVVESHSNMVKSLHQENQKLRREREKSDALLRDTVQRALGSRSREETLAAMERDAAVKSLASVTQMYLNDVAVSSGDVDDDSAERNRPAVVSKAAHRTPDHAHPAPPTYPEDKVDHTLSSSIEPPMRAAERGVLHQPEGRTMAEELLQDADQEAKAWRTVLGTYRFDQQPLHIDQFDDSLTVLRRVAVAWMRLGKLIHDDAELSSDRTGVY
jgi:hypothetical protein